MTDVTFSVDLEQDPSTTDEVLLAVLLGAIGSACDLAGNTPLAKRLRGNVKLIRIEITMDGGAKRSAIATRNV